MVQTSTITIPATHAERARTIARHLGIPTGAYLAMLIDQNFEHELGVKPSRVTRMGDELLIATGGPLISIPVAEAQSVADQLREIAAGSARERTHINLDVASMLSISRRGTGVILEKLLDPKVKHTIGIFEARQLADEIVSFA